MRSHAIRGRRLARGRRPRPSPLSIHYLSRGHLARQPCHQLRSFCLLYAAFRLNALLWNGGQHECRILVLNLDRYHCLWHLDYRWHDRRWLAFGLGAHGTAYRHCGFDQPLSSNSRFQNPVAESVPALFSISTARTMNLSANLRSSTCVSASLIVLASSRHASA